MCCLPRLGERKITAAELQVSTPSQNQQNQENQPVCRRDWHFGELHPFRL